MKVKVEFEVWQDAEGVWRAEGETWLAEGRDIEDLMREVGRMIWLYVDFPGVPRDPAEWLRSVAAGQP